jgi:hypothetical protein
MRLSEPCTRPTTSKKIWYCQEMNPRPGSVVRNYHYTTEVGFSDKKTKPTLTFTR